LSAVLLSASLSSAQTITGINTIMALRDPESPPGEVEKLPVIAADEVQGYGCLILGSVAIGLTMIAGPTEVIQAFVGAPALPASVAGTVVVLGGTVFASSCALGALTAPAIARIWHRTFWGMPVTPAHQPPPPAPAR
jgi:hypothetical protein